MIEVGLDVDGEKIVADFDDPGMGHNIRLEESSGCRAGCIVMRMIELKGKFSPADLYRGDKQQHQRRQLLVERQLSERQFLPPAMSSIAEQ